MSSNRGTWYLFILWIFINHLLGATPHARKGRCFPNGRKEWFCGDPSRFPEISSYEHPGRRAQGSGRRSSRILFIRGLFPSRFLAQHRVAVSFQRGSTGPGLCSPVIQGKLLNSLPGVANVPLDSRNGSGANPLPSCVPHVKIYSLFPEGGSFPTDSRFGDGSHKKN